jgi:prephenate dehydratase|tara:strand:- start:1485 stop:2330 length:846 start_codon:yes stop_codon:yes gene_type:complete
MKQKIAIQGELGSYSHLASNKIYKDPEVIPCKTFNDTLNLVKKNKDIVAVIPIENSIAGRVADVHFLLPKYKLKIIGESFHVVNHCLLATRGNDLKNIKIVKSHSHAIGQCQEKINKYNLSPIIEADTAGSAKKLSEENRNDVAVIASELAAEIYQLDILEKDFEDVKGNTTRFLIMSSNETKKINYDKNQKFITTCIFKLKSTPAALYNSLGGFASHSVNLTKLESFTVNNTFDQALFYLDIEGHDEEEGVKASLDILKKNTETLDILGVYQASDYRINH